LTELRRVRPLLGPHEPQLPLHSRTPRYEGRDTLTANASPEPVVHGRTITVKGTLTRANWETHAYAGLSNVSVKLQFRKSGTSTYTTLKTVTSGSGGAVTATTTATSDGYYRFSYAGTTATGAATSASDFVDVQ
ncbi:hypothetical protein ACWC94_39315, partial [Streptomyces sp. NPDC001135]